MIITLVTVIMTFDLLKAALFYDIICLQENQLEEKKKRIWNVNF